MITAKTFPIPILPISFPASTIFKASLKSPVFANLDSPIVSRKAKIVNKIKATTLVIVIEPIKLANATSDIVPSTGDVALATVVPIAVDKIGYRPLFSQ